mmetsp:Transcript_30164/g.70473  ORF Transcript_30164/g.70473 Transcript_30164/m.70473 type:complete len:341 (-) Transcript_30164:591-1613(-)
MGGLSSTCSLSALRPRACSNAWRSTAGASRAGKSTASPVEGGRAAAKNCGEGSRSPEGNAASPCPSASHCPPGNSSLRTAAARTRRANHSNARDSSSHLCESATGAHNRMWLPSHRELTSPPEGGHAKSQVGNGRRKQMPSTPLDTSARASRSSAVAALPGSAGAFPPHPRPLPPLPLPQPPSRPIAAATFSSRAGSVSASFKKSTKRRPSRRRPRVRWTERPCSLSLSCAACTTPFGSQSSAPGVSVYSVHSNCLLSASAASVCAVQPASLAASASRNSERSASLSAARGQPLADSAASTCADVTGTHTRQCLRPSRCTITVSHVSVCGASATERMPLT